MLAQFEDDMPTVERHCTTLLEGFMDADPYVVGTYYTSLLYAEREQFKLLRFEKLDACARDYFRIAGSRFVLVWHQSIVGPTRFLAGDLQGAIDALEDGMDAAAAVAGCGSPLASIPALLLAEIHYERNDVALASELVDRHLALASGLGFVDQLVAGYLTSSRLARLRGDAREAERILGRGMDLAHARGFGRLAEHIVAEQMTRSLAEGDLDRARRLATVHELRVGLECVVPKPRSTTRTEARANAWVSLARAEGRIDDALEVARRWQRFAERSGAVRSDVRWSLVVAQILLGRGDARAAERVTRRAIASATPGRFVRSFLDIGATLTLLLGDIEADSAATSATDSFTNELLQLAGALRTPARARPLPEPAPLSEPLNAREVEIVRLVASGFSNRDIADRLGMTEGTVKWHLHRIFDKVGARRRTQVVHHARSIGLLG
jgi:LuxR family maltose regulon positive regulatory protein